MENDIVQIFTGAACRTPRGPMGFAAVMVHPKSGTQRDLSGSELEGTINRAAVRAAILGLSELKKPCEVWLYSESNYLVCGYNMEWQVHSNPTLWVLLRELATAHNVRIAKPATGQGIHSVELATEMATEKASRGQTAETAPA